MNAENEPPYKPEEITGEVVDADVGQVHIGVRLNAKDVLIDPATGGFRWHPGVVKKIVDHALENPHVPKRLGAVVEKIRKGEIDKKKIAVIASLTGLTIFLGYEGYKAFRDGEKLEWLHEIIDRKIKDRDNS